MSDYYIWFQVALIMVLALVNSSAIAYRRGVRRGSRTRQKVEICIRGTVVGYVAPPNIDVEIIKADEDAPDATPAREGGAE